MDEEAAVLHEINDLVSKGVLGQPKRNTTGLFAYLAWPVLDLDLLPEWIETNYKSYDEIRFYEMES